MRVPNLTIRALMVGIAFFAVCATAIREDAHPRTQFIFNGSLSMLSGLLLGILMSPKSDRGRRFLIGFQVFGWVAILAWSVCYAYFPTCAWLCFSYGYLRPAQFEGGLPRWTRGDCRSFRCCGPHCWNERPTTARMSLRSALRGCSRSGTSLRAGSSLCC
jgi:hypothetical protein